MSKPKTGKLDDAAALTVLGRTVPEPPPAAPIEEIIARFQLETEQALATQRQETIRLVEGCERRVAGLVDDWSRTRGEIEGLRKTVESAIHDMRQSVSECLNAQRESARSAQAAQQSAAVFDKLRASQPDFHRMVKEQNTTVATIRDAMTHVEERMRGVEKRLDEFDVVADDYEETKGAVRGLDVIVKDVHGDLQQRRRAGARS